MLKEMTVFTPEVDTCIAFDEAMDCLPEELNILEIAAFFVGVLDNKEIPTQQREAIASLLVPDLIMH